MLQVNDTKRSYASPENARGIVVGVQGASTRLLVPVDAKGQFELARKEVKLAFLGFSHPKSAQSVRFLFM